MNVPLHPRARIEHEPHPRQPNRVTYKITGDTRQGVQDVMDNLYASVEGGWGYAAFHGPVRYAGGYIAEGDVVVYMPRVS